jgi:hypothetical protein
MCPVCLATSATIAAASATTTGGLTALTGGLTALVLMVTRWGKRSDREQKTEGE